MGEVFVAFDEKLERRVAVKLVPLERSADVGARARMLREARAASALRHPGIVTVHEIGEAAGRTFIVMELVEGETFAQLLARRGPLPPAEALGLVAQVAEALGVAHGAGILHRDVKCANLMVDDRGLVKVLDFGLSKRVGAPASVPPAGPRSAAAVARSAPALDVESTVDPDAPTAAPEPSPAPSPALASGSHDPLTAHGARMGTPGYAAPELLAGEDADARSDVFSLGVVLYELLTGERPYPARDWQELTEAMAGERFVAASQRVAGLAVAIDAVLARALRPRRDDRFATPAELVAAARGALTPAQPQQQAPASRAPTRVPPARSSRRTLGLLALAATLLGGLALGLWLWRRAERRGGAAGGKPGLVIAGGGRDAAVAAVPAPRRITSMGGCVYTPTFAGNGALVFDHTLEEAVDLYRVEPDGSALRRLTDAPAWEWRASPGRSRDEIAYLAHDPTGKFGLPQRVGFVDIVTGQATGALEISTPSVAMAAGDLYYIGRGEPTIRRVHTGLDEVFIELGPELKPYVLAAAPGGERLVLMSSNRTLGNRLCLIDLATRAVDCPETESLMNARPAFSSSGDAVYYASREGIHRFELASRRSQLLVPGVSAPSGVATAPDGSALAWSDCAPSGPLLDLGTTPPRVVADERLVTDPSVGADGRVAYLRHDQSGAALMLQEADGTRRQLTSERLGGASSPAFDRAGSHLAFTIRGEAPGIYSADLALARPVFEQVTDGALDDQPVWLADGRIVFQRIGPRGLPETWLVSPGGGEPVLVSRKPRLPVGTDPGSGEVLLAAPQFAHLFWWNPATGRERAGPVPDVGGEAIVGMTLSRDARWMVLEAGRSGHLLYRMRLDRADARPELVLRVSSAATVNGVAITVDGHVLAAPSTYVGDLWLLRAAPGRRF